MPFEQRTALAGSERRPPANSQPVGSVDPTEVVRVTIYLRRKGPIPQNAPNLGAHASREQFEQRHGAEAGDIALVERFAHEYQLTVVETSLPKRRVVLAGTAAEMATAFGSSLSRYRSQTTESTFRGRTGELTIPTELEGVVTAVLGLDTRPVAKPHIRRKKAAAAAGTFTPPQVAALYSYPTGVTGAGQTIAIIELGGGYKTADLTTYFSGLGVKAPTVTAVSVDGGKNSPGSDADGEVMLDIEVAGAIAPGASIAVYFAPNTDQGFIDAITDAVHDSTRKPSVVSISWGGPEDSWTQQSQQAMNSALQDAATLGVTVTVAAGDNGSSDGAGDGALHVDFPASSPYALACGGTTLKGSGTKITSEVVWNETANNEGATGGGVSNVFALPSYQSNAQVPKQPKTNFVGRGVPDVAGNADPSTGYQVRVDGSNQVVGGTSAVAPLWAALVALLNQKLGTAVGLLQTKLYTAGEGVFHDITSGNNDDSNLGSYQAQSGWDACTGLGTPNGTAILNALSSMKTTKSETGAEPASTSRSELPGSTSTRIAARALDPVEPNQEITISVIIRRPEGSGATASELLSGTSKAASRSQAEAAVTASPADMKAVADFLTSSKMKIVDQNPETRTIHAKGTVNEVQRAFGVQLGWDANTPGSRTLTYNGDITIPSNLSGIITAVLGLDQRPIAEHHSAGRG